MSWKVNYLKRKKNSFPVLRHVKKDRLENGFHVLLRNTNSQVTELPSPGQIQHKKKSRFYLILVSSEMDDRFLGMEIKLKLLGLETSIKQKTNYD